MITISPYPHNLSGFGFSFHCDTPLKNKLPYWNTLADTSGTGYPTYPLTRGSLWSIMCFNMVVINAMGFEPKPDPLYTPTQPCKVFRVTRFTVLPATPRNLCNTLAGISHSLHHIETHYHASVPAMPSPVLWQGCNVFQYGESMLLLPGSLHIAIGWYPTFARATRPTILSGFAPFWSGYS